LLAGEFDHLDCGEGVEEAGTDGVGDPTVFAFVGGGDDGFTEGEKVNHQATPNP
jgi:hypothetical protein